jgi:hypothetical protein
MVEENTLAATIASVQYKKSKWTKKTRPTKMKAFIGNKEALYARQTRLWHVVWISSTLLHMEDIPGAGVVT